MQPRGLTNDLAGKRIVTVSPRKSIPGPHDFYVSVVKVGMIELEVGVTSPFGGQAVECDHIVGEYFASMRLIVDIQIQQFDHFGLVSRPDAAYAQVGSAELAHPASMNPLRVTDVMIFWRTQNEYVPVR